MRIEELVYGTKGNETYLTLVFRTAEISELAKLEPRAAVYLMYDKEGNVVYAGETSTLKRRISLHLSPNSGKKEINRHTIGHIEYTYVQADRYERAIIEGLLVNKYQPTLNCDDLTTNTAHASIPTKTMHDILFYIRNTDLSNRVIAKALNIHDGLITSVRNNGLSNQTVLPDNYLPTVVITEDFIKSCEEYTEVTKELFFEVRETLEKETMKIVDIGIKFDINTTMVARIRDLYSNKFKQWEKERLELAA